MNVHKRCIYICVCDLILCGVYIYIHGGFLKGGIPKSPWVSILSHGPNETSMYVYIYIYTLWLFDKAMENSPSIDGLAIKNDDFPWLC